jgi:DNA (cytosine-5)-methyltransferase 1
MLGTSGLKKISTSKHRIKSCSNHIARRVGRDVQERIDALKIGQKMQDLPEELWHPSFRFYVKEDPTRVGGPNLRMIRLDPAKPSLTVTGYIFNKFVHPYENRFITVREAARLQGFPDNHQFVGTLTSTQLQVGNAVPIQLAQAVFGNLGVQSEKLGYGNRKLSALSLFSGAGGMDIGADNSERIETKVAFEYWKDACQTLERYYGGKSAIINADITQVEDPSRLWLEHSGQSDAPDLIYGGPPCQAFSQAGKQKGLEDDRGKMINEFLRFIENIKPAFFVMENVSGLKGVGGGNLYNQILEKINSLQYNCTVKLLLAADYGAPQLRRRLFFLGCRKEIGHLSFPEPTHGGSIAPGLFDDLSYATVGEAFEHLPTAIFSDESRSNGKNAE